MILNMSNKLRDIFCTTKVDPLELYKELKECIPDGACQRCKHLIGPDPYLPGYITDFGSCDKNMECFESKVCHLVDMPCLNYEDISLN